MLASLKKLYSRLLDKLVSIYRKNVSADKSIFRITVAIAILGVFWAIMLIYEIGGTLGVPPEAVAILIAPVLGGMIVLIASETNRENELNKHREKWCSDVRDFIGEYCGQVSDLSFNVYVHNDKNANGKDLARSLGSNFLKNRSEVLSMKKNLHKIRLYLEREDCKKDESVIYSKCSEILDLIMRCEIDVGIYARGGQGFTMSPDEVSKAMIRMDDDHVAELVLLTRRHLEKEWLRIKLGSGSYRYRRVALVLITAFIIIGSFAFAKGYFDASEVAAPGLASMPNIKKDTAKYESINPYGN